MEFDGISGIFNKLLSLLPTSPFDSFISKLDSMPYLGYLNWFLPISQMIAIGEAWLVAIGLFYIYQIALRWIKAIS